MAPSEEGKDFEVEVPSQRAKPAVAPAMKHRGQFMDPGLTERYSRPALRQSGTLTQRRGSEASYTPTWFTLSL